MPGRTGRILLLLLTIAVTALVVWRATTNEQARGRERMAAQHTDAAAADIVYTLSDLRASLYASVAPGQGADFWATRANEQADDIAARLTAIGPAAAAAGVVLAPTLEAFDTLRGRMRLALGQAQAGQPDTAGAIIFSDARDLVDQVGRELSDARQVMARAAASREGGMANEQSLLAGGLMAVWIVALILLVPVPSAPPVSAPAGSLGLNASAPSPDASATPRRVEEPPAPEPPAPVAAAPPPPAEPPATPQFQSLAALCIDLGRVADAGSLDPLLARAASLMTARGVVVWLLDEQATGLVPAIAHGYDLDSLARMGALPLADDNLTSTAFRSGRTEASPPTADQPAAVAVPMMAAIGPIGVLTAEVDSTGDLDRVTAIGAVVAAQLANLFPAPSAVAEVLPQKPEPV
jgi:hypothetical protein